VADSIEATSRCVILDFCPARVGGAPWYHPRRSGRGVRANCRGFAEKDPAARNFNAKQFVDL
jgi:hypothetical protein